MESLIEDILQEVKQTAKKRVKRKLESWAEGGSSTTESKHDEEPSTKVEVIPISNAYHNDHLKVNDKDKPKCPPTLPPLPANIAFFAPVGYGKTNAATNLLRWYMDYGTIDSNDIYIISPTFDNNPAFDDLHIPGENIFSGDKAINESIQCVDDVIKGIYERKMDWLDSIEYKEAYDAVINNNNPTLKQRTMVENRMFEEPHVLKKPCPILLLDDMVQTAVYKNEGVNPYANIVLRNRHLFDIGITNIMLLQTFKGLAKKIRQNINVFLLWRTYDQSQVKSMYDEVAPGMTAEQFEALYNLATEEKHSFLYIDNRENDPKLKVRKNFDTSLLFEEGKISMK